jgi:putative aminophosphonate oxidoreductase
MSVGVDPIPPVLDRKGRPRSLWLAEALASESEPPTVLEGDMRADICIVGGGYTGLWTAIHLKRSHPSLEVALIEADICGGGASGRNGGFVLTWWTKLPTLVKCCGVEDALRLARASEEAVIEIGRFCEQHGIDAHYRHDGWLWAATTPAQVDGWVPLIEQLAKYGVAPFKTLTPQEAARLGGAPTHLGGIFEPTAASVQPALLARGLRRVAIGLGILVFEHSPMTTLHRGREPRVETPRGSVTATRVILAHNAWSVALPELRRAAIVVASGIIATERTPDRLRQIGLDSGLVISDTRLSVNYYRTTRDGRLVFGRGGGTLAFAGRVGERFNGPSPRRNRIEQAFRAIYPQLADVKVTTSWMGPVARTVNGLVSFGPLAGRPDVIYAIGFAGNGVGPSWVGGRILASLALERRDEWASCGLTQGLPGQFPREPLRYLAGRVVRQAVEWKEDAEDRGRKPGRIVSALAGFAPPGLVPVKSNKAHRIWRIS